MNNMFAVSLAAGGRAAVSRLQRAGRLFPAVLFLIGCCSARTARADAYQPVNLETWNGFDGTVAEEYEGLTNWVFICPPTSCRFSIPCGRFTFSPDSDVAGVTNFVAPAFLFGVPVWRIDAVETVTVSRVWLYTATDGTPFRTNDAPSAFDPRQWVRDVYRGDPPAYLTGAEIDEWYKERARDRFVLGFTLISSNDWPTLRAATLAAATNNPPPGSPPLVMPADSNRLAFAAVQASSNTLDLSVYTPVDKLPVDLLTIPALEHAATPSWLIRSTFSPSAPFDTWSGTFSGTAGFFLAARTDIDSDGDGISDCREIHVLGTDPDKWDSAGLAIGDFARMYVYGLDPLSRDTNGDGMDDDEAIMRGLNPATQDAGAGASEIRYVHDADDRLLGAFTTTPGGTGGGAATYTLSPAHNAQAVSERSAP